jgi:RNA polymerase sigma-70 factor, ECF subfamily
MFELVRRLDPQSLTQHLDGLYRAAWALCGSREDAEDLVQETCARVLARPRFVRADSDRAYLMSVLRNTFYTAGRVASRRPKVTTTLDEIQAPEPRNSVQPDAALEVKELYALIAELPDEFRLALVAVDVLGLSYAEAGRALGVREATITTRLFRARQRVALAYDPQAARVSKPTSTHSDGEDPASPARSGPAREGPDSQTRLA